MELTTIFKKNTGLILEEIDGAYLLMNESDDAGKGVYISNTAVDIFNLCDGKNTLNDIVKAIMNEYQVDYDTCLRDVENCLEVLASEGIITRLS
jgi:pantoate kinase